MIHLLRTGREPAHLQRAMGGRRSRRAVRISTGGGEVICVIERQKGTAKHAIRMSEASNGRCHTALGPIRRGVLCAHEGGRKRSCPDLDHASVISDRVLRCSART